MAVRAAALAVALLPGLAAWAVVGRAGFGVLLVLGLLALLGGLWTLAQPLGKRLRFVAAAVAFTALPGTTAVWMGRLAGSFRPYSLGLGHGASYLPGLTLPIASEGAFDPYGSSRRIVNLDRYGAIHVRGWRFSLAELDEFLARAEDAPLLLRADRDTPFLLCGWLADAARAAGLTEVRIAASKYAGYGYTEEEANALRAEPPHGYWPGYWPEVELVVRLGDAEEGPGLRLAPLGEREWKWGPVGASTPVTIPVRVRYELAGRTTTDLAEVARWLAETAPARIEPEATVPLKFVVAVLNELKKAGRPVPPLVTPYPASAEIRKRKVLPYPRGG